MYYNNELRRLYKKNAPFEKALQVCKDMERAQVKPDFYNESIMFELYAKADLNQKAIRQLEIMMEPRYNQHVSQLSEETLLSFIQNSIDRKDFQALEVMWKFLDSKKVDVRKLDLFRLRPIIDDALNHNPNVQNALIFLEYFMTVIS